MEATNRGEARLAAAEAAGAAIVPWLSWRDRLPEYDLVFNTVPALLLGEAELRRLRGGVLIVDLACEAGVDVNGKLAKGNFMLRWAVLIAMILAVLLFGCYGADFDGAAFLYTNF